MQEMRLYSYLTICWIGVLLMASGTERNIDGGWLLSQWTCCGVLPGIMYGSEAVARRIDMRRIANLV